MSAVAKGHMTFEECVAGDSNDHGTGCLDPAMRVSTSGEPSCMSLRRGCSSYRARNLAHVKALLVLLLLIVEESAQISHN